MGQHWHNLSLDTTNILNPQFVFPSNDLSPFLQNDFKFYIQVYEPAAILSDKLINTFNQLSLPLDVAVLFYRPPNTPPDKECHLDIYHRDHTKIGEWAVNILLQTNEPSYLRWHEIDSDPNPRSTGNVERTADGLGYKKWDNRTTNIIDQCLMQNDTFTLVNTGFPHSIGHHDNARWCLSLRPHKSWSVQFQQAAETYFKDLIV